MIGRGERWTLGLLVMLSAGAAAAQHIGLPQGRWWEQPKVAEQVGLSPDQTQQLNALTVSHARTMVDLKGVVEKAQIDLRSVSDAESFDAKQVRQAFAALQQARLKLESERFEMLLKVRQVLTSDQWRKLREFIRERRGRDPESGGEPGTREQQRKWRN